MLCCLIFFRGWTKPPARTAPIRHVIWSGVNPQGCEVFSSNSRVPKPGARFSCRLRGRFGRWPRRLYPITTASPADMGVAIVIVNDLRTIATCSMRFSALTRRCRLNSSWKNYSSSPTMCHHPGTGHISRFEWSIPSEAHMG